MGSSLGRAAVQLPLLLLALTLGVMAIAAAAENTPPTIEVDTPQEGAHLALTVTVSGIATDAEGFNTSSYVEARWNDWEWFRLPSNAGQEGRILHFGELVNLDWHTPGDHEIHVRAYDGEAYSDVVTVPVTVRDLPDVVVLPTDITVAPEHVRAGEDATVHVQVRNQGGEDAENVEVELTVGGVVVGTKEIPVIEPYSVASVDFEWTFEEGNVTVVGSARPQDPVVEKSTANNQAEVTFLVRSEEWSDVSWKAFALVMGTLGTFFALILVAMAVRPGDRSRKG